MTKSKTTKTSFPVAKSVPLQDLLAQRWPELRDKIQKLGMNELFAESVLQPEGLAAVEKVMEDKEWSRRAQLRLIEFLVTETSTLSSLYAESVVQWIRYHDKDDFEAVIDCIQLLPPPEVTVIGRLPKTGSQKIVFRANWKLQQRTVILKKLLSNVLQREMRSHPLSANHPNIIKTYPAQNAKSEQFVIEELLDEVLSDDWKPRGIEHTALLLHDIASALKYIDEQGLIHGDVKPDNIGFHGSRFILLDFGICRPAREFTPETSATGSLRTRAPELIVGANQQTIGSDIWALGAVIARLFCGRFPLVDPGEKVPRVSDPEERQKYEKTLYERVAQEYDTRIAAVLAACRDQRIKDILERMLAREPIKRPKLITVVEQVKAKLGYAIPESEGDAPWTSAPSREIELLAAQWPDRDSVERLPLFKVKDLLKYVGALDQKLKDAPRRYQDLARQMREHLEGAVRS